MRISLRTLRCSLSPTKITMNNYLLDPNICPSSLGEDDTPIDPTQTAHKWDDTMSPITCAECGTTKDCEYAKTDEPHKADFKNEYGRFTCEKCA